MAIKFYKSKSLLILLLIIGFSVSQPSLTEVKECSGFTTTIKDKGIYNQRIRQFLSTDTIDSRQTCTPNGCTWEYDTELDTMYSVLVTPQETIESCINFDLYDETNAQYEISLRGTNLGWFKLKTISGDTLTQPGNSKTIYFEAEVSSNIDYDLIAKNKSTGQEIFFPFEPLYKSTQTLNICNKNEALNNLSGDWNWFYSFNPHSGFYEDPSDMGVSKRLLIENDSFYLFQNENLECSGTLALSCLDTTYKKFKTNICHPHKFSTDTMLIHFYHDLILIGPYDSFLYDQFYFVKPGFEDYLIPTNVGIGKLNYSRIKNLKGIKIKSGGKVTLNNSIQSKVKNILIKNIEGSSIPVKINNGNNPNKIVFSLPNLSVGTYFLIINFSNMKDIYLLNIRPK